MELAGNVTKKFMEKMARARLTLNLDGEYVMKGAAVGDFMGNLTGPVPESSPFTFNNRECLFTAHRIQGGNLEKGLDREVAPLGYFLPRGTQIRATIEGVPKIPEGVEVRIGGIGSHYGPDTSGAVDCASVGSCNWPSSFAPVTEENRV